MIPIDITSSPERYMNHRSVMSILNQPPIVQKAQGNIRHFLPSISTVQTGLGTLRPLQKPSLTTVHLMAYNFDQLQNNVSRDCQSLYSGSQLIIGSTLHFCTSIIINIPITISLSPTYPHIVGYPNTDEFLLTRLLLVGKNRHLPPHMDTISPDSSRSLLISSNIHTYIYIYT